MGAPSTGSQHCTQMVRATQALIGRAEVPQGAHLWHLASQSDMYQLECLSGPKVRTMSSPICKRLGYFRLWHAGIPQLGSLQWEDFQACMTACLALQGYWQALPWQGRGQCLRGICQTHPSIAQLTASRHQSSQRLPETASSTAGASHFLCQHFRCRSSMGAAPSPRKGHLLQH